MALDFNYGNVKDYKTVCLTPEGEIRKKTEAIIWGTMMIGLYEIKKSNLDEWMIRITMLNTVRPGTIDVNLGDLERHVGLRTNARSYTPAKFRKMMAEALYDEGKQEYERQRTSLDRFNEEGVE